MLNSLEELKYPQIFWISLRSILFISLFFRSTGSESLHGEAKVVARVAIQLLAGEFVEENPGYTEQIGFVLLQYILVLPKVSELIRCILSP